MCVAVTDRRTGRRVCVRAGAMAADQAGHLLYIFGVCLYDMFFYGLRALQLNPETANPTRGLLLLYWASSLDPC